MCQLCPPLHRGLLLGDGPVGGAAALHLSVGSRGWLPWWCHDLALRWSIARSYRGFSSFTLTEPGGREIARGLRRHSDEMKPAAPQTPLEVDEGTMSQKPRRVASPRACSHWLMGLSSFRPSIRDERAQAPPFPPFRWNRALGSEGRVCTQWLV